MSAPRRGPIPDGGIDHYRPGSAPPVHQVDDRGMSSPYATGTMRLPVTVRCERTGCGSAISMPHGSPENVQRIRLEVAGWTKVEGAGWVCHLDHEPLAAPVTRVAPLWARVTFAVGAYLLILSLMVWPVWLISGWTPAIVVNAALVTVVWWGLVALTAARRRRRPQ